MQCPYVRGERDRRGPLPGSRIGMELPSGGLQRGGTAGFLGGLGKVSDKRRVSGKNKPSVNLLLPVLPAFPPAPTTDP